MRVIVASVGESFLDNELQEIIREFDQVDFVGIFYVKQGQYAEYRTEKNGIRIYTHYPFSDNKKYFLRTPYHDKHYERILSVFLADSRTYFFAERLFGGDQQSVFNNLVRIEQIIWNSLAILYHSKPDRIVSGCVPHDITWFFAKVAELMGVPVYFSPNNIPLPWKRWIVKNLEDQTPVPLPHLPDLPLCQSGEKIHRFISKTRSPYHEAIPDDSKKHMERYHGGFFLMRDELSGILTAGAPLSMLLRRSLALKKKRLLDLICRDAKEFVYPENFVVFFLHYQWESTTLPDGYQFAQQWLAIRALAESLPPGWFLVVKEHPGTFNYDFDPKVRDTQFYDALHLLPKVIVSPLELSPFDLIDRSLAVSTITGTVGVEALIRGKPVLVFGAAQYRGVKGIFSVKSMDEIRSVFQQIEGGFSMPTDAELVQFFEWVDNNSFDMTENSQSLILAIKLMITVDL